MPPPPPPRRLAAAGQAAGDRLQTAVRDYGGGFYGLGAVLSFAYMEVRTIIQEWSQADGLGDFLWDSAFEIWIGISAESIVNGVYASIWPIHWWTRIGGARTAVLAVSFWLAYELGVRAWRWAFPGEDAAASGEASSANRDDGKVEARVP